MMRILHLLLVFWQVALLFAGCFWRDYNSAITMLTDEPGESPPRSLRGFRRRWSERSAASESHGASPHEFAEPFGHASLDFMDDVASEQMGGFGAFDSWMYIPECAADGTADNYEPESPVETLLGDIPALKVSGPAQRCLAAVRSCPGSIVPSMCFSRTDDRWHGTALANLSDMFQPAALQMFWWKTAPLHKKFEAPALPVFSLRVWPMSHCGSVLT